MTPADVPRLALTPLSELGARRFDVVVVGGGITGAGVARHAAACGLSTLLLEADDFAAGTSSRSTKLIHGGLRYLAMGDFALVREGVRERRSLLAMAPHLTEPRWMLVPARSLTGFLKLRLGIGLYEWLGDVPRAERHRNWHETDLAAGEPLLDASRLRRACVYREYLTDDARLVLAALRAAAADGAHTCNYAPVTAIRPGEAGCTVAATDLRTGATVEVEAACVVNAAGPWVESLLPGRAGGEGPRLHLSKGVHVVVPRQRLPVENMVMMTAADGRPVFAISRGPVTYVGTTDTSYGGRPDLWPEVTADDVTYLVSTVNAHFRMAPLTADDVVAAWAGLRPLVNQPGKAPKEMSRREEIWRDGALVTVAGGKLTGFRKMAEEAMNAVGEVLGREVRMPRPLAPLAGGAVDDVAALITRAQQRYQLEPAVATRLVRLYGGEVFAVLGENPAPASASTFVAEIEWSVDVEGARTLEDVVYRRLRAAWFLPAEVDAVTERAADVLSRRFAWSDEERARQVRAVHARVAAELGFDHSAVSGASR